MAIAHRLVQTLRGGAATVLLAAGLANSASAQTQMKISISIAQNSHQGEADKKNFKDAATEAVKANRARVDTDEKTAVADLRAKGMQVTENVDKAKFQAALAPVYAEFAKQFGQANLDRIKNYK